MERIAMLAVLVLCPAPAAPLTAVTNAASSASYQALDALDLAAEADLIVVGTVMDFDHADPTAWNLPPDAPRPTLEIEVERVLVGPEDLGRVRACAFIGWMCASRYAPYARGQRAIFFLEHARDEQGRPLDEPPRVLGAGNEGEWPIHEREVLVADRLEGQSQGTRAGFGPRTWTRLSLEQLVPELEFLGRAAARHARPEDDGVAWRSSPVAYRLLTDEDVVRRMEASPVLDSIARSSFAHLMRLRALRYLEEQASERR